MTKVTPISVKRIEFAKQPGDYLSTGRVQLDSPGPTFRVVLRWLPTAETWILDLYTADGTPIVKGAWVRDRTDCLLGISTPGRPLGAIMSYDPKGRGDPVLDSFYTGGVGLYYVPAGMNSADFSAYTTQVV